jgi:hypothetical protein
LIDEQFLGLATARRPARRFARVRFPAEVIAVAVRWYLRYGLSYRGIEVDHVTVYRWGQRPNPFSRYQTRGGSVRDAPPDNLVDPRHDVGIRIDVAAGEPPHLNEGARDDARDPKRVRYLAAHPARHRTRDPVEQLAERVTVVVGDPAEQPPQAVCTTTPAGRRGTATTKGPRDAHVMG